MRAAIWPAVYLAAVAGYVDSLGYLALSHVFTAHMSGNAAAAGAYFGTGHWSDAALRAFPIPAFVAGVMVGALAVDLTARRKLPMRLAPAFGVEVVLLITFLILCPREFDYSRPTLESFALISLLSVALGVQSATLRQAGGERIRTTFVTGMLTRTGEEIVAFLIGRTGRYLDGRSRVQRARHAVTFGSIFVSFMMGAVLGAVGQSHYGANALAAPILALVFIIADDIHTAGAHFGGSSDVLTGNGGVTDQGSAG